MFLVLMVSAVPEADAQTLGQLMAAYASTKIGALAFFSFAGAFASAFGNFLGYTYRFWVEPHLQHMAEEAPSLKMLVTGSALAAGAQVSAVNFMPQEAAVN
jgi:predicted Na+-dependent transporter